MAYTIKELAPVVRQNERTHGTGTGTLYVGGWKSADGVVDVAVIFSTETPSTTDTYGVGSQWTDLTNKKIYIKTAATTWTLVASNT